MCTETGGRGGGRVVWGRGWGLQLCAVWNLNENRWSQLAVKVDTTDFAVSIASKTFDEPYKLKAARQTLKNHRH